MSWGGVRGQGGGQGKGVPGWGGDWARRGQRLSESPQFGVAVRHLEARIDNKSALSQSQDPASLDASKHIDLRAHFLRERVRDVLLLGREVVAP